MPSKVSAGERSVMTRQTTPIPPGTAVPDEVRTRRGALRFSDGFPDDATLQTPFDNLDFQRATMSYLPGIAPVDMAVLREMLLPWGRHCWTPPSSSTSGVVPRIPGWQRRGPVSGCCMRSPSSTPPTHRSLAPRRIRCTSRRTCPSTTSGALRSTTRRHDPCCGPSSSGPRWPAMTRASPGTKTVQWISSSGPDRRVTAATGSKPSVESVGSRSSAATVRLNRGSARPGDFPTSCRSVRRPASGARVDCA